MSKRKIKNPGYIIGKGISNIQRSQLCGINNIPYCENPAIGINAPKCSEDCCKYGSCHKRAYFEHIANKYNTTVDKIGIATNWRFDKFVIEDREYSNEEVLEILKKHKAEEDKKYHKCERCGIKYLDNKTFNMIYENLENDKDLKPGTCVGYIGTPFITGIQILSKCGIGKKIKLCDNCIKDLINWLGEIKHK